VSVRPPAAVQLADAWAAAGMPLRPGSVALTGGEGGGRKEGALTAPAHEVAVR
jgi:2-keto-4-pentenoate hydratase